MFKWSARYFVLALTLVALTATVRPAHAYAYTDDPCTDPSTGCVVGSTDPPPPPPNGQAVSQKSNNATFANSDSADNSQSLDDMISYLMVLYGLA